MNTCRVCRHAARARIDVALQQGIPLRTLVGQFGTSRSALQRHKAHARPPAAAGPRHDRALLLSLLQQAIAEREAVIASCIHRLPTASADWRSHHAVVLRQSTAQLVRLRAELRRWEAQAPHLPAGGGRP